MPWGGDYENGYLDTNIRIVTYIFGLMYIFIGVAIAADLFMNSI